MAQEPIFSGGMMVEVPSAGGGVGDGGGVVGGGGVVVGEGVVEPVHPA